MPARPHFVRAGRNIIRFARLMRLSGENFKIFTKAKQANNAGNIRASLVNQA